LPSSAGRRGGVAPSDRTPRTSTVEQLSLDLQDGKVGWIDTDCRPEGGDGLVGFTLVSRPDFFSGQTPNADPNRDVCWRTSWGRGYAADADELSHTVARSVKRQFDKSATSDHSQRTRHDRLPAA
jgi:hypothetical protein